MSDERCAETSVPPRPRRPRRRHWWRELIVDAFRCADEAWRLQAEAVSLGYQTELDEYAATHPRPTLQGFMLALAGSTRPATENRSGGGHR